MDTIGSTQKECTCSKQSISKYINKISGPLLDRIDIQIEVEPVEYSDLNSKKKSESSIQIRKRVNQAREIQEERYKKIGIHYNSELNTSQIEKYCKLNVASKQILKKSFEKLNLSVRAYTRIIKVARTIADLEKCEQIEEKHIAEAIQYRTLDKKYWTN